LTDRRAGAKTAPRAAQRNAVASMKGMKSFGRYGSLGFELLGSIAVGYYVGVWLDKRFGTHWIAFAGFLLGCYAGFRALFKAAKTMQRDIENDERLARGEDPWAPKPKDDDDVDSDVLVKDDSNKKESRDADDAKR
jgi:ATP synthase protein I